MMMARLTRYAGPAALIAFAFAFVSASAGAQEWRTVSSLINPEVETIPFEHYDYVNPEAQLSALSTASIHSSCAARPPQD